jgi:hypothetical protein
MATSHPYISGAGNIAQMIKHLRNNFPAKVTSETVKKLGIAPNNESYVINALQFIGLINEEGKKTERGGKVLTIHKEEEFRKGFEELIREAYKDLFDLYGDGVWEMDTDAFVNYFRQSDQTSAAIGQRQAKVFQIFAAIAGHGAIEAKPTATATAGGRKVQKTVSKKARKKEKAPEEFDGGGDDAVRTERRNFGLTVRVEINLPADGTRETYDNIFKSIKANLIDE